MYGKQKEFLQGSCWADSIGFPAITENWNRYTQLSGQEVSSASALFSLGTLIY